MFFTSSLDTITQYVAWGSGLFFITLAVHKTAQHFGYEKIERYNFPIAIMYILVIKFILFLVGY